ncbi:MAG: hypothetical protein IJS32_07880 [Kiritimatiellae bacterium]|nr:hypothetical protein [Kiritimatiellia bacterium]
MKKTILAVATLACVLSAWGLNVPIGERRTLSVGDEPDGFFVSEEGRDCVRVTLPPAGSGLDRVTVEGRKEGRCSISFYRGNAELKTEEVVVTSGIDALCRSLRRRLEASVPGVVVEPEGNKLVLTGKVANPEDWKALEQILGMEAYRGKVENLVAFEVEQRVIEKLKREIARMGFRVTDEYPRDTGTLQVLHANNELKVSGTVYSQADLEKLRRLLAMQSWLSGVGAEGETARGKRPTVRCRMNVAIDDMAVNLYAAIMAVSESATRDMGAGTPTIRTFYNAFYDFIHGPHHGTTDMRISASIGDTLTAFAGNGIMRGCDTAQMQFNLNRDGEEESRLKWGGTMKLQRSGTDGNGNLNLSYEDVDYGFTLKKLASRRISADTVELKLEIDQCTQPVMEEGGAWSMEQHVFNPIVRCKFGETVIIGGYGHILEESRLPAGMPLLRHIPIVNWFVSKEGHVDEDATMLIAVSVTPVESGGDAAPLMLPKDITYDVQRPNAERLKERQRHQGCWTPLNWLAW